MERASYHGRFLWYDLLAAEPKTAIDFYTNVAGWGSEKWQGPMPYTLWTLGDSQIGGVIQLPREALSAGTSPNWLAYVGVTNIEESLTEARELGAKVLKDMEEVPTVGKFAVIQDPQGAAIAIYTPFGEVSEYSGYANIGEFSWHELATTDLDAAWEFYARLFNWNKTEAMDMGEMGIYQMYGRGEHTLGGIFQKPPQMPVCMWLYYVFVENVKETVVKIKEAGGQVLNGPTEVPGGDLIAQCLDSQGAAFAIHSKKS
jgi:predicted enzyme related to lactoylglutathione lyase